MSKEARDANLENMTKEQLLDLLFNENKDIDIISILKEAFEMGETISSPKNVRETLEDTIDIRELIEIIKEIRESKLNSLVQIKKITEKPGLIIGLSLSFIGGVIQVILGLLGGIFTGEFAELFYLIWTLPGVIAIIGAGIGLRGNIAGSFICLIAVAIQILIFPPGFISFLLLGGELIIGGGIISLIFKEKKVKREFKSQKPKLKTHKIKPKIIEIEEKFDKIEDLEELLKARLSSDWEIIKNSYNAYEAGEIDKTDFIEFALKKLGVKFSEIFNV